MNKIKTGNESIKEIVDNYIFDSYNRTIDFLKDNRGSIAQTALGVSELYAGINGAKYAGESGSVLFKYLVCVPVLSWGIINTLVGSIKTIYNPKEFIRSNKEFIPFEIGIVEKINMYNKNK
ncbi:MAG: hypothetical protein PHV16_03430 [Candidatus Nanoarchaeia archaeon]|nr:hypothetical protein [Candidatus Nanoarchaeia archaeon]